MEPWVDAIKREHNSSIEIVDINLDRRENHEIGRTHRVRSVPTQLYLAPDNHEVRRHEGIATQKEMKKMLCDLEWVLCK
jgi:hypothetical protein